MLEFKIFFRHLRWIWQQAWDPRKEFFNAYLITCPVPNDFAKKSNTSDLYVKISKNSFVNCRNELNKIDWIRVNSPLMPNILATDDFRQKTHSMRNCLQGKRNMNPNDLRHTIKII